MALIRDYESRVGEKDGEYCFVDLGFRAIRMYMFHGPRHVATRALDVGLSSLTDIIAEAKGVDAVYFPFHKANEFLGMTGLPTFLCVDVMKRPAIVQGDNRLLGWTANVKRALGVAA